MQPVNQKKKAKEQKNMLNEVLFKYLPYWPVFVILMAVSMFGAWFYLRITPPMYEASASIMIKDESKDAGQSKMQEDLDPISDKKLIENEVEVLKSKTLMKDVIKNLNLYASFFEEGEITPKPAYTSSPVIIQAANPDAVKKVEKIPFSFSESDSQVVIGSKKYPLDTFMKTPYGNIKFVPNKHFSDAAVKPLFFKMANPKVAAEGYSDRLKILSSKANTVITLNFRDAMPERAEDVLNELIAVYNKASMEDKKRLASSTLNFINERLQAVTNELQQIEEKEKTYKSSKDAVELSSQSQNFLKSSSDIDTKISEADMQLAVLDEVEKHLKSTDNSTSITTSTLGLKDPVLTDLLTKLTDKELNYERLKKTTGEANPIMTALKSEINKLKPNVLENIRSQRSSLEASKLNLHSSNNTLSSMLQTIPKKEQELIEINREHDIKSKIHDFLLQKQEATELVLQSTYAEARIVDKAQANFIPVSPKGSMMYMVAIVFAIALPVAFIAVKGMFNNKVLFRDEIENLTSFPIIGEVMLDKSKDPLVIKEGKRTFIAEQFRRIRTSLAYLGVSHAGKKRVLVTSSLSGEGKSFVALNLALSLAMTGKKVVLLELDLANPSLSKKLEVDYEQGVSNYLLGECEPENVIKRTAANNNLFFVPCGTLPDNPSELIMNERLKELLTYLEDIFDHVVIDSAPASLLSDAYVLSPMCHATLYVVKHKFTPKVYLERLEQENSVSQLSNVGIIFNGIKSRGFTKNGYGYGYGYGYVHDSNGGKKKKVNKRA
jgi:capsular exopolysaccharide synthesis family protein